MSNKEKLLTSAQKFLTKGQVPRAIKDYEKVIEIDPRDIRSRQKLAELYSRARMTSEAIDAFEWVAKWYAENGFYLKAIAVYKQMQRLDPSRPAIYLRLAQLNEKQGLVGNALAEYRALVSHFEKSGKLPEAVNVLQKMKELEPENLNIRVKTVEIHLHAGSRERAWAEFSEVAALLESKRDYPRLQKIYDFFLPHFSSDPQMHAGLARVLIRKGEPARGIEILNSVLKDRPGEEEALRLLAEGYRAAGQHAREREIFEQLLEMRPEDLELRGAILRARLDGGEFRQALTDLDRWKDSFIQEGQLCALKGFYERLRGELPEDEQVILTLQSIYEKTGEGDKLFDMMSAASGDPEDIPAPEPERKSSDGGKTQETDETRAASAGLAAEEQDGAEEIPLEFLEGIEIVPSQDSPLQPLEQDASEKTSSPEFDLELDLDLDFDELDLSVAQADAPSSPQAADPEEFRSSPPEGFFDLRAAVLDDGGANSPPAEALASPKKGIKTDVDVEDSESHYNLGIAYKEMGLLDDAVKEFDKAMQDPALVTVCLMLKGICLAEKGALPKAEEAFMAALARPGLAEDETMGLHYELGLLYEGWDRPEEALQSFQGVAAIDPLFRDAGEKIRTLQRRTSA